MNNCTIRIPVYVAVDTVDSVWPHVENARQVDENEVADRCIQERMQHIGRPAPVGDTPSERVDTYCDEYESALPGHEAIEVDELEIEIPIRQLGQIFERANAELKMAILQEILSVAAHDDKPSYSGIYPETGEYYAGPPIKDVPAELVGYFGASAAMGLGDDSGMAVSVAKRASTKLQHELGAGVKKALDHELSFRACDE